MHGCVWVYQSVFWMLTYILHCILISTTIIVLLTQYYADANEAESWMKEKDPLVSSVDYGRDGTTAKVRPSIIVSVVCIRVVDLCK